VQCMFYFKMDSNIPTVAVGPKPVYQQHANSMLKVHHCSKIGMSPKNLHRRRPANCRSWYKRPMPIATKV
jgi:hypothetical protein